MKRPILFRGKRIDGLGWAYGYLIIESNGTSYIHWSVGGQKKAASVISETVGQFTGFTAVKYKRPLDTRIFEGDLFRTERIHLNDDTKDCFAYSVVMWISQRGAYYLVDTAHYDVLRSSDCQEDKDFAWLFDDAALLDFSIDMGLTKVGNIHENKDLM